MKTKDRKKYIFITITVVTLAIAIYFFSNRYILKTGDINKTEVNKKIETSLTSTENIINDNQSPVANNLVTDMTQNENVNNEKAEILTTYKGYPVIAKLEVPKIELETYVISEYSEKALGVSVTKFYGGNPNEIGNFCIAGHNYIAKNMFHDLKNLSNGDEIILTDLNGNKVRYVVYLVETVNPNETNCLSQKTNGKVEVTLITCTTDSSKRIIVKAEKS